MFMEHTGTGGKKSRWGKVAKMREGICSEENCRPTSDQPTTLSPPQIPPPPPRVPHHATMRQQIWRSGVTYLSMGPSAVQQNPLP